MDQTESQPIRLRDDPDLLLTYSEFASLVKVPERTVRGWVATGSGPRVVAIGRHRRIRASDALAWLDTRYVEQRESA